jgi:hypothetical protein
LSDLETIITMPTPLDRLADQIRDDLQRRDRALGDMIAAGRPAPVTRATSHRLARFLADPDKAKDVLAQVIEQHLSADRTASISEIATGVLDMLVRVARGEPPVPAADSAPQAEG